MDTLSASLDRVDAALGRGLWLKPADYETMRDQYAELAAASEALVLQVRRLKRAECALAS